MVASLFSASDLLNFSTDCFISVGVPEADARWTSHVLLKAELQGRSSHGISRLPAYVQGIARGKINPAPHLEVVQTAPACSIVDGDNGLGPVVGKMAIDTAIRHAQAVGVGAVSVKHGNHAGALGIYTSRAADEGLIGLAFTNAQPAMPPSGGRQAFFGTNPIAMSAGRGDRQIVVDLATSVAARGNIIMAAKAGESIPEGWAIDTDGVPTTNAAAALIGAVLPMAGPKGYSLALLVEILAGVLSGAAIGQHVGSIYDDKPGIPDTGMFFLTLNPALFVGQEAFEERLLQMEHEIHSTPLVKGVEAVFLPGERRRTMEELRMKRGVPLPEQTAYELRALAEAMNLACIPVV